MTTLQRLKALLIRSGLRSSYLLEKIVQELKFFEWARSIDSQNIPRFSGREELYAHLQQTVLRDAAVDYLEFGVYQGASLRAWTRLNQNPNSRFFGFDTFEGLPEDWQTIRQGTFSTEGLVPELRDSRVQFVKGLFQDTLDPFGCSFRPQNRLLLHLDADLYTSTLAALATFNRFFVPNTILLFDEFAFVMHEFRAFVDYVSAFRRPYRVLALAGDFYRHVAVEILTSEPSTPLEQLP